MNVENDLLKGAEAAAKALGMSRREVYYLLDQKLIPAKKKKGRWYFYRSDLLNSFKP